MKNTKLFAGLLAAGAMTFMFACKKDPGPGGKAHIHGHVEIEATGAMVPSAMVEIWYDATSKPSDAADANTTTDAMGEFEFENMNKGDYFLHCMYTDTSGTLMGGVAVTIDKKKEEVDAHIHLE